MFDGPGRGHRLLQNIGNMKGENSQKCKLFTSKTTMAYSTEIVRSCLESCIRFPCKCSLSVTMSTLL